MKLRFLCASHKVALTNKPRQAINCWQNGFDTGQFYHDQALWQEALPHAGCAFETAEILITTNAVELKSACELFICSAQLLEKTFKALGYFEQSQEVIWTTINRLERELRNQPKEIPFLNQQLTPLYQYIQASNTADLPINKDRSNPATNTTPPQPDHLFH